MTDLGGKWGQRWVKRKTSKLGLGKRALKLAHGHKMEMCNRCGSSGHVLDGLEHCIDRIDCVGACDSIAKAGISNCLEPSLLYLSRFQHSSAHAPSFPSSLPPFPTSTTLSLWSSPPQYNHVRTASVAASSSLACRSGGNDVETRSDVTGRDTACFLASPNLPTFTCSLFFLAR